MVFDVWVVKMSYWLLKEWFGVWVSGSLWSSLCSLAWFIFICVWFCAYFMQDV